LLSVVDTKSFADKTGSWSNKTQVLKTFSKNKSIHRNIHHNKISEFDIGVAMKEVRVFRIGVIEAGYVQNSGVSLDNLYPPPL
jgi:hypothetical protein